MSGRFVRASKYRHVFGEPARKDKCYLGIKAQSTGEANFVKGNTKFLAYSSTGGGGPVVVHRRDVIGKVAANPPTVNVHKAAVLDFDFSPFVENMIATGSEDGYVKVTVFPEAGLTNHVEEASATLEGHGKKLAWLHFHPTAANVLGSSSFDNTIRVWDISKSAQLNVFELPDLPQSFEWNANGSLIATTCKDKTVKIYDPRHSSAVSSAPGFPGAKGSRLAWMDNHNKLAVVGFSPTSTRQYAVYDPRNFTGPIDTVDIDSSAGVFTLYYDPDNSILYMGGKGDAGIKYFEAVDEAPYLHFLSEFRHNESQKGLGFLPKRACDARICEVAVALRLMVDYIQPVSFTVPRKSDQFQEDIFPDTYAGIPALTADEWLAGANKDAPTMSMKPGTAHAASGPKTEFKPSTSGSVNKELEDTKHKLEVALQRIKELEEEVARLKHH